MTIPDPFPLPLSTAVIIRKKARRVCIIYASFLEFGPIPGCSACENSVQIIVLNALSVLQQRMAGKERFLLPRHFVVFLLHQ